ncbi:ABC transporter ATP-binding protein [uncultured Fusobacterium sp.]|uniref:ABC transporter ATP-binding protein n=1 Tax=uncultured Fusobacterium sp. TaxID=159267 RepID=UPI0025CCF8C0|nr:ABC transporter ATP-binding protein [uncultured Fusobacterium sp.]
MLEIKNLTIKYEDKGEVVKRINLSVEKGEIIGIVGESGSGKSTLIKSIVGGLSSDSEIVSGTITFENRNSILSRGKEIAMIFQDNRNTLNPIRKIGSQFIELIQEHSNLSKKEAREKVISMLKRMNLPDVENIIESYPHQLSGGMCQRVGIAMAMVFNPKLLLADEPTSALDVTTQAQIVQELINLRDEYGTAIIIVTHNLGVAAYMSDRILVMKNGEVVEEGITSQVIKNPQNDYTKLLISSVPELRG